MKLALASLFLASGLFAGQAPSQPATPAPAAPAALPHDFVGAGVFYNQDAKPRWNGYGAYAVLIGGSTYSYNVVDFIPAAGGHITTATETGVAQYMRDLGKVRIFALADAGVAVTGTASGTSVGAAYSGGGMAVFGIKKGWTVQIPVRVIRAAGGTQTVVGLGIGWGH